MQKTLKKLSRHSQQLSTGRPSSRVTPEAGDQTHRVQVALGRRIRRLREQKGWAQERFAAVCKIDRSYMGQIERGNVNLTLATMELIARKLGISVYRLLNGIA
jgi:ribosome-binding protein aMBF1 (putative translation factor)